MNPSPKAPAELRQQIEDILYAHGIDMGIGPLSEALAAFVNLREREAVERALEIMKHTKITADWDESVQQVLSQLFPQSK